MCHLQLPPVCEATQKRGCALVPVARREGAPASAGNIAFVCEEWARGGGAFIESAPTPAPAPHDARLPWCEGSPRFRVRGDAVVGPGRSWVPARMDGEAEDVALVFQLDRELPMWRKGASCDLLWNIEGARLPQGIEPARVGGLRCVVACGRPDPVGHGCVVAVAYSIIGDREMRYKGPKKTRETATLVMGIVRKTSVAAVARFSDGRLTRGAREIMGLADDVDLAAFELCGRADAGFAGETFTAAQFEELAARDRVERAAMGQADPDFGRRCGARALAMLLEGGLVRRTGVDCSSPYIWEA